MENIPARPRRKVSQVEGMAERPRRKVAQVENVPARPRRKVAQVENLPARQPRRKVAQVEKVAKNPKRRRNGVLKDIVADSEENKQEEEDEEEPTNKKQKSNTVHQEAAEEAEFDTPGLSEYEKMIQRNIKKKQELLETLEIFKEKNELQVLVPVKPQKPSYRGITKERKSSTPTERRRSLRQQNLTPDGSHLVLPTDKEIARAEAAAELERHIRPPPGPAPLMEYCSGKGQDKQEVEQFVSQLQQVVVPSPVDSVWAAPFQTVIKTMKKMKITAEQVAKVVPERTFSVQVHPSLEKTLVLVGAKWGELGIWDVESREETAGAYYFRPHSRPINCLTVDPWQPSLVHTTSYDGSLRTTDLAAARVQQVYSYVDDDLSNMFINWHAQVNQNTFLVAASHGKVVQVDTREGGKGCRQYLMYTDKNVKVVAAHPTLPHYFASASRDGNVCLWDVRSYRKRIPVSVCPHSKAVSGLEFSPVTGNSLLSTCSDDYIRIIGCDLINLNVVRKLHHNNHTGRWLTTFKARFVPGREDLFLVGSMAHPRQVEVWGSDMQKQHTFQGENLSSVNSVVALHPTRPVLAGANSSGRAFVFM